MSMLWKISVELTEDANLWRRFYSKVVYINRLEFLSSHVKKGQVDIPEFVIEHDKKLEARPLMDYGFEVDPVPLDPALRLIRSHLHTQFVLITLMLEALYRY